MVRLIPVEIDGKVVWTEDAPDVCPAGHLAPTPTWTPCEVCGWSCRHWRCAAPGCTERVRDDEHQHRR